MIRYLSLHLIIGMTILTHRSHGVSGGQIAAELCKNPLVTSATQTPYGVICLIPKPISESALEDRQQFVRSLPKMLKSEQNDNPNKQIGSNYKPIPPNFVPQTNILSKRSIFSNWFQKFYDSLFKSVYKSLIRKNNGQSDGQTLPQAGPGQPLIPGQIPDQFPTASAIGLTNPSLPQTNPFIAQESQFLNQFISPLVPKPDSLLAPDFGQSALPTPVDLQSDMGNHYDIPLHAYPNEDIALNEPVIDESRLGPAVNDLPHYNYGSVRQLATYLHSIQEKINRQKFRNIKDDEQSVGTEFNTDYSPMSTDANNDKHESVIPLYADHNDRDRDFREGRASEQNARVVNSPRKLIYEFQGYKKDMDCRGRFKPLKSMSAKEVPKNRRKRYIELDYSKMQLRKLPVWLHRNEGPTVPEAIVEVKPRSLFRWRQPMMGWRPIVPPEELRKDLFLKRNGDPLEHWDHEQVESRAQYQWQRADPDSNETDSKVDTKMADSLTIESLKNLDLSKSSVVIERRSYGNRGLGLAIRGLYENKGQPINDKKNNGKYDPDNYIVKQRADTQTSDKFYDNQVIGSEPQFESNRFGVKAVEVENVDEDITKAKSLEDIAAIPGAVIKAIDPKLTDILLKVLSHNTDFSEKRITNAYFLEFPKLPEYKPRDPIRPVLDQAFVYPDSIYKEQPMPTGLASTLSANYDLDIDKDIQMTDTDYEYGEIVCAHKHTGGVADVRKNCRIYFQCTQYTIDTYVCPSGTRFDDSKQYCLPSNQVICG